jgi:hypothetical protein
MAERRAPRFALEVLFLAALAAALTFANLRPLAIVGVMLVGWTIAVIFEWGALRTRPHYGSGLPPRWYMPPVSIPPPRPLEQVAARYPAVDSAGDAPTWIASPAMLADWPVAEIEPAIEEQTQVHDMLEVELAVAIADARAEAVDLVVDEEPELEVLPEAEPEPAEEEPVAVLAESPRPLRLSRHRIDPLEATAPKGRRFGKRVQDEAAYAEVPARPTEPRALPSRPRGDD